MPFSEDSGWLVERYALGAPDDAASVDELLDGLVERESRDLTEDLIDRVIPEGGE